MEKVLWVSPNFNHYKARFLNHLAKTENLELTVIAGSGVSGQGHDELASDWCFKLIRLAVPKKRFGYTPKAVFAIIILFKQFDWVMIPREKEFPFNSFGTFLSSYNLCAEYQTYLL